MADVDTCDVRRNTLAFWWLGQHGFIIKTGNTVLYIDSFLSEHPRRVIKPPLDPREITNADLVLGTHDHTDHIDRISWPAIAIASPQAKFVVPEALLPKLSDDLAIERSRFIGLNDLKTICLREIKITGIAAAHEFLDYDQENGLYPYLGYIIKANGCCVYHAGDCCIYEGLISKLKKWPIDVAILPINGRDAKRLSRGCIGNMTYQEAADMAGAIRPSLTIPSHYEMFKENSEDPQLFIDYMKVKYPSLKVGLCRHGQKLLFDSGGRDTP
ncbi:MAG: MBL fold metallo-hydrolase [Sedimentisphaerales bacterium]